MAMELEVLEDVKAHSLKQAIATVILPAGKTLKIETSPNGEEVFSAEVPAGKTWSVQLIATIQEMDV